MCWYLQNVYGNMQEAADHEEIRRKGIRCDTKRVTKGIYRRRHQLMI